MSIVPSPKAELQVVQNGRNYLDTLANKFIVKPKSAHGIGGFIFDYEGEETVRLHADITDNYVEDNTAIQDHAALNPTRITMRGFNSELVLQKPAGLIGAIQTIQNRLGVVPAYLGKYTPGVLNTINKALTKAQTTVNTIDLTLAKAKNIVGLFDSSVQGKTVMEKAYSKLQALWATRQAMIVETPFGMMGNMMIEDIVVVQDQDTRSWIDISVTLKNIRFVEVQTSTVDFRGGRNAQQAQTPTDKGSTKGTPVQESLAYKIFHGGG